MAEINENIEPKPFKDVIKSNEDELRLKAIESELDSLQMDQKDIKGDQ